MIKRNIVIFFMLMPLLFFAQAQGNKPKAARTSGVYTPPLFNNRFSLKTSPLSLIDLYSGSCYKVGTEIKVFGNNSINFEVGGYFKHFNGLTNINGFLFKSEIRHYLVPQLANHGYFMSLEHIYKEQSFNFSDSILLKPTYYKEYKVEKFVTCFNFKFGKLTSYKRLVFEVAFAAGVRFKNVHNSLTEAELNKAQYYGDSSSAPLMVKPGHFIYPNVDFSLRIGYALF